MKRLQGGAAGHPAPLSTLGYVSHLIIVQSLDSSSTLIICLTAHHLVDALLAIAVGFLTYFCKYGRTTEQFLKAVERILHYSVIC